MNPKAGPPEAEEHPEDAAARERAAEELRAYEVEREERRRRRNAVSGRLTGWLTAAILLFLAYDSVAAALDARSDGESWAYPAVVAGLSVLGAAAIVAWLVRRR